MENTNWWAFAMALAVPFVLGRIWYDRRLFGRWLHSEGAGRMNPVFRKNVPIIAAFALLTSGLLVLFLTSFVNGTGQEGQFDTFTHGMWHGAFLAVVVVLPTTLTLSVFTRFSIGDGLIHIAYWTVTLAVVGGIVDVMHHWG